MVDGHGLVGPNWWLKNIQVPIFMICRLPLDCGFLMFCVALPHPLLLV